MIKKKTEPHLVFHYPPHPGEDNSHFKNLFKDDSIETTSSSSDDEESTPEEEELSKRETNDAGNKDSPPDVDETGSASPQKGSTPQQGNKRLSWNDVLGYNSGVLAKALCPARGRHKRFEMSLGNTVMLGRPVYAKEDGNWRRKKPRRRSSSMTNSVGAKASQAGDKTKAKLLGLVSEASEESSNLNSETDNEGAVVDEQGDHDPIEAPNSKRPSQEEPANLDPGKAFNSKARQQVVKDNMVMFHVVFVLRPPPLEYHTRVKDVYEHLIKKFTRALKWEQARSGYVAKEAALISSVSGKMLSTNKEHPPLATLYHDIISQSSLAKAIATLYNGISNSKIAHVKLTPNMSLSLQIPIATSISILPTPLSPQKPGMWLTTATSLPTDEDIQLTGSQYSSHFTLLLLSDLHTILADVNAAASPITSPLTHYLHVSKSTKSFLQISQVSGIPLADIQFLASHLIYWRRARAIPPLRQSDIYIVSPNADMRDLSSASSRFAKAFPIMPPLPRILSMLSASPKPYSTLIPNKDRKEMFMDILAWLLRGGWVTQLQTFILVRIPPKIKATVDEEGGREETKRGTSEVTASDFPSVDSKLEVPDLAGTSPTSSTHTALPVVDAPSIASAILIPNPQIASALPSRYLSAVSTYVGESQGTDSKTAWEKCLKYFDGKHAVETIAVREGWKRKHVMEFITDWEALGILSKVRHW